MFRWILLLLLCLFNTNVFAEILPNVVNNVYPDESTVPENYQEVFYSLTAGKKIGRPRVSYSRVVSLRTMSSIGFSYSCGHYNFFGNLHSTVNAMKSKAREFGDTLEYGLQQGVAAFPSYLFMTLMPKKYRYLSRQIDKGIELFRLSVKDCKQIESELSRGEKNPYRDFVSASFGELWKEKVNDGDAVAVDVKKEIDEAPPRQLKFLGGKLYGTEDNPIQIIHDMTLAGYNLRLGRTGDVSVTTEPNEHEKTMPIVAVWSTPTKAAEWAQKMLGDEQIVLGDGAHATTTKVPYGPQIEVDELSQQIYPALEKAINTGSYKDLNKFSSARLSSKIAAIIREQPKEKASLLKEFLVRDIAISEVNDRLELIKTLLITGINCPDVVNSMAKKPVVEYVRKSALPDIEMMQRSLLMLTELKSASVSKTSMYILSNYDQSRRSASAPDIIPPHISQ